MVFYVGNYIDQNMSLSMQGNSFLGVDKHTEEVANGSVVKNPPANTGGVGSIPRPERAYMPRSNWARAPQLLSLCSRAWEP